MKRMMMVMPSKPKAWVRLRLMEDLAEPQLPEFVAPEPVQVSSSEECALHFIQQQSLLKKKLLKCTKPKKMQICFCYCAKWIFIVNIII